MLHGEALSSHVAVLTDELHEVRSALREELVKQRTLPVIMATSLNEKAIAKSHRGRVVGILESDGSDNVIGVYGERQILSVLSSEAVLDNLNDAIQNEEMATLTSSLAGMEIFRPIMDTYEECLSAYGGDNAAAVSNSEFAQIFIDSLRGNLRLLAGIRNLIDDKEIRDTMKLVGLDPDNKNRVANYSLGMRQRLGIAQAIMENPDLLILDEPFNGLDKNGIVEMRNLLKKLCEGGKTIIMSSHNPYDIETICDKVFEVEGGKLFER